MNGHADREPGARLRARAIAGTITRAGYDQLRAEARARAEYPPFVCKIPLWAEPDTGRPAGVVAWLAELVHPEPGPEAEIG